MISHILRVKLFAIILAIIVQFNTFAQNSSLTIKVVKNYDKTDGGKRYKSSYRIQDFKTEGDHNLARCHSVKVKHYQKSNLPSDKVIESIGSSTTKSEKVISLSNVDSLMTWFKSSSIQYAKKDRIIINDQATIYIEINRNGEELTASFSPNPHDHKNTWKVGYINKVYNPKLDSLIFHLISKPEVSDIIYGQIPSKEPEYHISELNYLTKRYADIIRKNDTVAMLQLIDDLMPTRATAEYFRSRNIKYGVLDHARYKGDLLLFDEQLRSMRRNMHTFYFKNFKYISQNDEVQILTKRDFKTLYIYFDYRGYTQEIALPKSDSVLESGEIYFDILINGDKHWMKFGEMFRVNGKWKVLR